MSWEDKVRKVEPYVAGEQPKDKGVIKLNTNECPYPPAPGVMIAAQVLRDSYSDLRLYPDMDATMLVNALAEYYMVDPDQIFVGVGSDDVLALCFLTFFTNGSPILFPDITYSFYDVWADLYGISYENPALQEDFSIRAEDYLPAVTCKENGGVIIANPNAPTGLEMAPDQIERIVAGNPDSVVIIDEAYVDFGGQTALPLLEKYDNLLVVQTFSKSRAMAGERIGFAIGNKKMISYLKDVKFSFNSYTMNLPSIVMGTESVKDAGYFRATTDKIIATRERFKKGLRELGFVFPDSHTNFVFAGHPDYPAKDLFMALRERRIFVRYFSKPRICDYLRITIGTDYQMDAVLAALQEIMGVDRK